MPGTITVSESPIKQGSLRRFNLDWLSDASGDASGTTINVFGYVRRITIIPDGGGTAPTSNYDLVINDANSVDVAVAAGANLSATVTTSTQPEIGNDNPAVVGSLELVVSNAGNAKGGNVVLYIDET